MIRRAWIAGLVIVLLTLVLGPVGAEPVDVSPIDCEGPAPYAEPGTNEFRVRDSINMYCSEERKIDQSAHPVFVLPVPNPPGWRLSDAYRAPDRHDGVRFRFFPMTIAGLATEVYLPCSEGTCTNTPEGLQTFEPPYPAVISIHGGISRKELHWWSNQTLAEAGYLVVAPDGGTAPNIGHAQPMLDWLLDPNNPFEVDINRIGIAGHSLGAGVATTLGQGSPEISAIVAWDGGSSISTNPDHNTPELFEMADYTTWPGYPVPYSSVANTVRASGFATLRNKGVDTMVVNGRAVTHIDWTGGAIWGNRYAELVNVYYNIAWFDRHLRGKLVLPADSAERAYRQAIAQDAYNRLIAGTFDASADRHNISQGFWDPVKAAVSGDPLYGGNVPYTLAGKPVADRLSFYYRSVCFVSVPDYVAGNGAPGDPLVARADTTPDGNIRTGGCPQISP